MKIHRRRRVAVLVVLLAFVVASMGSRSLAAESTAMPQLTIGQSLESALVTLNTLGYRITFSTALVRPHMRLATLPDAREIERLLRQLLQPWDLVAERLPDGSYRIVRAYPAAHSRTEDIVLLAEVNVTASRFGLLDVDATTPLYLDRDQVAAYPHLADDAVRTLRVLPGVAGGDFSARLHLRGGRRDEVALRVDGAEIHDPYHLRELDAPIGMLDTHLVESMALTTGGQTADFGGRMSGSVDIKLRTPHDGDEYRHAVGASFITSFARTSGRYANDRGYYLLSARRGYLDLVFDQLQSADEIWSPGYSDVVAKVGYALGERTALTAGGLFARDDMTLLTDDQEYASAGGADTAHLWLTLDHEFANGVRVNSIAAFGTVLQQRDSARHDPAKLVADLSMRRTLDFATLRQDWTWQPTDRHLLRLGFNGARYLADFDYDLQSLITDPLITIGDVPIDNSRSADLGVRTTEFGAYAAWRTRLGRGLVGELGLRYDRYGGDLTATRASPRLNLVYDPGGPRQYRLAWSRVYQPQRADELQVEDGVTQLFRPERADQLSLGVTQRLGDRTTLRIDAYVKRYADQRPRFENLLTSVQLITEAEAHRVRIAPTEARAQGVEMSLHAQPTERTHVWTSVVLSESEDRDETGWHARLWDQPVALSAGVIWAGSKWQASVTGNWHTGWPTTLLYAVEDGNDVNVRAAYRNGARFNSFSRIDLRVSRAHRSDSGVLTWYLEVYNLLNTANRCCVSAFQVDQGPGRAPVWVPEYDHWMPRLPSFGIQYEF